jgi:hypothetical protein
MVRIGHAEIAEMNIMGTPQHTARHARRPDRGVS